MIWAIDATAKTAQVWIQSQLLARSDASNPFPAVNGTKIYDRSLFASNTQRQFLIRIPLTESFSPGTPEVFLTNVNLDDFAFDTEGNLYGATHVYQSVIQISPEKQITTIAKAEQGMAGSTALAFGRSEHDLTSIYVTTNGGMSFLPPNEVQPGQVIRLEIGMKGLRLGA